MIPDELITHTAVYTSRIEKGLDDLGNPTYFEKEHSTKCFLSSVTKRSINADGGQVFYEASVLFVPPSCNIKKGDSVKSVFAGSNKISDKAFRVVAIQSSFDDDGIDHYEVELSSIETGNAQI